MANPIILDPVQGDDPCGPDMRWDPAFMALSQGMDLVLSQGNDIVDGERAEGDLMTFDDIVDQAETLCARTKDLRVLYIHAEAIWRGRGFAAFAEALEDMMQAVETWPGAADGIHPRADPEDGDLGDRNAPIARLVGLVPVLAGSVAWGPSNLTVAERQEAANRVQGILDGWTERLGEACGPELASVREVRQALTPMLGAVAGVVADADGAEGEAGSQSVAVTMVPAPTDAWELIAQAADLMAEQDHHSPAVPVLRLLLVWKSREITEIADLMRPSGVTLEQLLESIKQQQAAAI